MPEELNPCVDDAISDVRFVTDGERRGESPPRRPISRADPHGRQRDDRRAGGPPARREASDIGERLGRGVPYAVLTLPPAVQHRRSFVSMVCSKRWSASRTPFASSFGASATRQQLERHRRLDLGRHDGQTGGLRLHRSARIVDFGRLMSCAAHPHRFRWHSGRVDDPCVPCFDAS